MLHFGVIHPMNLFKDPNLVYYDATNIALWPNEVALSTKMSP